MQPEHAMVWQVFYAVAGPVSTTLEKTGLRAGFRNANPIGMFAISDGMTVWADDSWTP